MGSPLSRAARSVTRFGAAAQNALEVARFGGLRTEDEPSPFAVVAAGPTHRLRRYFVERGSEPGVERGSEPGVERGSEPGVERGSEPGVERPDRPPVLLVPPLMVSTEVYDVSPATSGVSLLAARGIDPWVVDFGAPEHEEGGLDRTVTDHVLAVSDAIDAVREATGQDVHLGGYSQGGMFCYQAAAYRRSEGIASLITFGSPVDTRGGMPFGLPEELVARVAGLVAGPARNLSLPAWAVRAGFQLLDPVKAVRQRLDFLLQLHDREALLPREGQRRFLDREGWVAYAGPAIADLLEQFVHHNRMLEGGFVIGGRLVTLADIDVPTLCFVGEVDEIARPATVRGILRAAPRATVHERRMPAGHFGLVVGTKAVEITWPTVAGWIHHVGGRGELPEGVEPMVDGDDDHGAGIHVRYGLELVGDVGMNLARSVGSAAESVVGAVTGVASAGVEQLPRLVRLERARRDTPMSMGLLLDQQARRRPDDTFFLFEDRAHTWADARHRIDNVVRGLLHVGVRQGEHVGVLMGTRPSALAVVAALSRLGAVAVMLRPDGPLEREAQLGQVTRIIADPEHAVAARDAADVPVLVLGGGGEPRELGFGLTDMERIDPDAVDPPAWYRPNPGRAEDLAFVLFTGAGERTRVNRITNRRWALSAHGTASAAALGPADTVYAITPLHHPSGLLTSIGGSVAGGARLALATAFDPATFWSEVRRYGVTVVSYTWTLCRDLVEAPVSPAERGHPVRLFVGSGMPAGLWRRVVDRFAPAGVLEFYASTEGGVVLGNTSGKKVGSKGRPLPGSADVAVAAYDVDAGRLVERDDGFAVACAAGEVGMLLARVDHTRGHTAATPLRGVFGRDDAWVATGDLFRVDSDGDFCWVDHVGGLVHTAHGAVGSVPVETAIGAVEAVDLVAVYGVRPEPDADEVVVAAVTERAGHTIEAAHLTVAVRSLPVHHRPGIVHVLDVMPRTTWFRPRKVVLREAGMPDDDARAWAWDDVAEAYAPR